MQNAPSAPPSSSLSRLTRARWSALSSLAVLLLALTGLGCEAASSETSVAAARERALVEVYVTDWCPYCRRLEAFLQQNKIVYERKNIEQSAQARAEHQSLGGGGIPVTRINRRQVIRGFKPDAIAEAIGFKAEPTSTQSSTALRMRPSASLSPSRKASAASCLVSPMSVTRTS